MKRVPVTNGAVQKQQASKITNACVLAFFCAALYSFGACLALPCFSTLPHKQHSFREKAIGNKMCQLIFSITLVWNAAHSKKN